jgi:hypothetical protein
MIRTAIGHALPVSQFTVPEETLQDRNDSAAAIHPDAQSTSHGSHRSVLDSAHGRSGRAADSANEPATVGRIEGQTATEINKNITDPVSLTWSLKFENDISFLDIDGHGSPVQDTFTFQPTLPILLTPYLKLITRPQFTLVDSVPFTNFHGDLDRTTGVGDTTLDLGLSPVIDPWIVALGPTFIFPTAALR